MIRRFDSVAELRSTAIDKGVFKRDNYQWYASKATSWYGDERAEDTLRLSETGDTRLVPVAEALLTQIDHAVETTRKAWTRGPVGAFYSVPDVLSNLPTPMRHMIHEPDERAPITVLSITDSSGAIPADVLIKRGTTILGLVLALSRIRPVTLSVVGIGNERYHDGTGETVLCTRINTTPLDLATACYCLTSQGFARRLTYGVSCELNGDSGAWPPDYYATPDAYGRKLAQALSPDPSRTLVITAARLHDELIDRPIPWINDQIRRFISDEERAA